MVTKIYTNEYWKFDPHNQEIIYLDGRIKQLPNRLNKCLEVLILADGKTVSYDQLLEQVWGTTHRDASTISSVISELRCLLAIENSDQKVIRTIPKKGYRFTLNVSVELSELSHSEANEEQALTTSTETKVPDNHVPVEIQHQPMKPLAKFSSRLTKYTSKVSNFLLGMVTAVSISALTFSLVSEKNNLTQTIKPQSQFEVITFEFGNESDFDVSEDGRYIAYTFTPREQSNSEIVFKRLSDNHIQKLKPDPGYLYHSPSISPDNQYLAYVRNGGDECEVWLTNIVLGVIEQETSQKISTCGPKEFWLTTDFSKDSNTLFFARSKSLSEPFQVIKHDVNSHFERAITTPASSGRGDYSMSISNDGTKLAFIRNSGWQNSLIYILDLTTDDLHQVTTLPYLIEKITFWGNSKLIYRGKQNNLVVHDLRTDLTQEIISEQKLFFPVVVKNRIYTYRRSYSTSSIHEVSFKEPNQPIAKELISSPYSDSNAQYGENGDIYFQSNRDGNLRLWIYNNNLIRLLREFPNNKLIKDLQYSSTKNALYGISEGKLFEFDLLNREFKWLDKDQKGNIANLSMPDNNTLLFSYAKDEQWELYMKDLYTGFNTSLNIDAFSSRKVGKHLYHTFFRKPGLHIYNTRTSENQGPLENIEIFNNQDWAIFQDNLLYLDKNELVINSLSDLKQQFRLDFKQEISQIRCNETYVSCLVQVQELAENEIVALDLPTE